MITLLLLLILIGLIVTTAILITLVFTIGWIFIIPLVVDILVLSLICSKIFKKKGGNK